MPRFEFDLRSQASPEAVSAALLDFTERRPELWPGLPADSYEVYEVGDTWAEIREGYRGPIWWRERYDWSVPGTIQWTAVDSGFGTPGQLRRVEDRAGGGRRVDASHHLGPARQDGVRQAVHGTDGADEGILHPSVTRDGPRRDRSPAKAPKP